MRISSEFNLETVKSLNVSEALIVFLPALFGMEGGGDALSRGSCKGILYLCKGKPDCHLCLQ